VLLLMPVFFLANGRRTQWDAGGLVVFAVAAVGSKPIGRVIAGRSLGWAPRLARMRELIARERRASVADQLSLGSTTGGAYSRPTTARAKKKLWRAASLRRSSSTRPHSSQGKASARPLSNSDWNLST
jgi:hypothetical protein